MVVWVCMYSYMNVQTMVEPVSMYHYMCPFFRCVCFQCVALAACSGFSETTTKLGALSQNMHFNFTLLLKCRFILLVKTHFLKAIITLGRIFCTDFSRDKLSLYMRVSLSSGQTCPYSDFETKTKLMILFFYSVMYP